MRSPRPDETNRMPTTRWKKWSTEPSSSSSGTRTRTRGSALVAAFAGWPIVHPKNASRRCKPPKNRSKTTTARRLARRPNDRAIDPSVRWSQLCGML
jgi:hypothetical protein